MSFVVAYHLPGLSISDQKPAIIIGPDIERMIVKHPQITHLAMVDNLDGENSSAATSISKRITPDMAAATRR
jgi:hypothetical protein